MENNNVNNGSNNLNRLVDELVEGRDLTRQLQLDLINSEPYSSNNEAFKLVIAENIFAKFTRSLQILQYEPMTTNPSFEIQKATNNEKIDSSTSSFSRSPRCQEFDGDFKDRGKHKDDSKKSRKNVPRVTLRVQGCKNSGLEGPIDDGYNWRKYGQKDIFGANYPRAYYRCTFKQLYGCLATKKVQRSNDDPSYFEVAYCGKHTCSQAPSSLQTNTPPKLEPDLETLNYNPNPHPQQPQNIMWDFQNDHHNIKDTKPSINITSGNNNNKSTSFTCPSSSNSWVYDQQTPNTMLCSKDNTFVGNNNFPTNTYHSPNFHENNRDIAIDYHPPEGVQDIIQPSCTSTSNSSAMTSMIPFDNQGEFDNDFIFDNPQIF